MVRATVARENRTYAAVASVSTSTTGVRVAWMTKALMPFFPIRGDDPALIVFHFSDYDQNPIPEGPEKQPYRPTMISTARRRFENACRLINREHRLFHGESTFSCAFLYVGRVVELVGHFSTKVRFGESPKPTRESRVLPKQDHAFA
jgi:hypothetical protein